MQNRNYNIAPRVEARRRYTGRPFQKVELDIIVCALRKLGIREPFGLRVVLDEDEIIEQI